MKLTESPNFKYYLLPIALGALAAWTYLSGGLFLLQIGQDFSDTSAITLWQYWTYYGDSLTVKMAILKSVLLGFSAVFIVLMILFVPRRLSPFGNAKLATERDIKKAGLFASKGIFLGKFGGKYLFFDRGLHVMLTAPTGSGKGVSIVIPNLLSWGGSCVTLDMKLENWHLTSGFRHRYGQACYLFAPGAADYRTHRFNPLAYINDDPHFRIDDINKIANMFFPDKKNEAVIWTAGPRSLFLGITLFIIETGRELTLGGVLRTSLIGGDPKDFFEEEIGRLDNEGTPLSRECVLSLLTYTSVKADNTRSGILGGFRAGLEIFMNPIIDAATSANDFDLREVRKKRMSIYVGITPSDIERFTPLIRLFFQILIDLNTRELPSFNKALKYNCLLIMDEFAQFRIDSLSKGVAFLRGYGLQLMPILQSPAQLTDIYGAHAAKNFSTNHAVNLVFPPKASDMETAKEISAWLGYMTITNESRSRSSSLIQHKPGSVNESNLQRALLMPQEITELPDDTEIVIVEKTPPILAKRVLFYQDAVFISRLKELSPTLRRIRGKPKQKDYENAVAAGELAAPVPVITVNEVTFAMPTIKNHFQFDWDGIKAPITGVMDHDTLNDYADALCAGAGVLVHG